MVGTGDTFEGSGYCCYQGFFVTGFTRVCMVGAVAGKPHQYPVVLTSVYRPVRTVMSVRGTALTFLSVKTLKWTLDIVLTGETHWLPYVPLLIFFAVCVPCERRARSMCWAKWWQSCICTPCSVPHFRKKTLTPSLGQPNLLQVHVSPAPRSSET